MKDFGGTGELPKSVVVRGSHTYTEPGTSFVVLTGTPHRDGDPEARWALAQNLARVRVVVTE